MDEEMPQRLYNEKTVCEKMTGGQLLNTNTVVAGARLKEEVNVLGPWKSNHNRVETVPLTTRQGKPEKMEGLKQQVDMPQNSVSPYG